MYHPAATHTLSGCRERPGGEGLVISCLFQTDTRAKEHQARPSFCCVKVLTLRKSMSICLRRQCLLDVVLEVQTNKLSEKITGCKNGHASARQLVRVKQTLSDCSLYVAMFVYSFLCVVGLQSLGVRSEERERVGRRGLRFGQPHGGRTSGRSGRNDPS